MAKVAKKDEATGGYAVVESGGKQYLLQANDKVKVELLDVKTGDKVDLQPVLALSDGKTLQIGSPEIKGAKVTCTVLDERLKDKKVISFKKKRRKGYSKKKGHRQKHVFLQVNSIG